MKLLLDTHILLWSLLDPARLTGKVASELENPANELWLSPITTWEILILVEKGRVVLDTDPSTWIRDVLKKIPVRKAPINHEISIQSRSLNLSHEDPADRFLAATAMVYDLTLVTADERLLTADQYAVLPNK
ncbi:MAG: type II toxin-antitoxin system VapC family toxin [Pseudomonadota bacterium]